ncbi:NACHT, LRR and PYD domains-containing protein 12-like isoform X3 [Tachysurus fulvidraco]|uniref:NACHT, LRR and PYD domains-containing protein 12-like isoform X3 n=1 Tax=Tachysurus fulvidraco TaxID=1234273 RepID=UPI001FEE1411|nr:NACHT, LRR and PYD domains-containing protein 12-like isoform X3 [Tachysurus fulvidraco]
MILSSTKDLKKRVSAAGAYLKRDWSREQPINLPMEESSSHTQFPEPGCVSVKSDMSREQPVGFQKEDTIPRSSDKRGRTEVFSEKRLDIFKEVKLKVIDLMKEELTRFRRLLSLSHSAFSEREVKDETAQNSVQEAVLKITLHVLRNMKLYDHAATLQNKMIPVCQKNLKCTLRRKFQSINERLLKHGNSKLLTEIFTELYITEGDRGKINSEHEVRQIEDEAVRPGSKDIPIKCSDVFKPLPGPKASVRTVLTKGVAGIGKTISVQKFIVDWAEGNENNDIHFIFPLPFRELNFMKEKKLSLMDLLYHFFPETSDLHDYAAYKVLFIFDGLDETRLPLDFQNNEILRDGSKPALLDVLLTNLIKGNLIPSALLWITSRPAAAHQIPPDCVDRVTEVRGFSDGQKEEYFRKRIRSQGLANRIITYLRSTRSLYIMCHIPVFCWITATVLERMLTEAGSEDIPKSLTQMFIYFLIYQTKQWNQRYNENSEMDFHQTRDRIVALGKLALEQLKQGNLIFYADDLMDCGIDIREVSVYSGMCTEIFRQESGLYLGKVYCFVHLSVQEFLAALNVFISFSNTERSDVSRNSAMTDLLIKAVDKTLHSKNGHLDLFLRFLLGISLDSNQALLRGFITPSESSRSREEIVTYIKEKIRENPSPEESINLFHCLNELNDQSLVQEVQMYLNRKGFQRLTGVRFSPAQWSALVFLLLKSEEKLEEINLNNYERSEECFLRLLPVIQASRKAVLCWCRLTLTSCKELASALSSTSSNLRELDLSNNHVYDAGVNLLSKALKDPNCKLESLKLCGCNITEKSCGRLASAFNCSRLNRLNLSNSMLKDEGIEMLCGALDNPSCKLESLKLSCCNLTEQSCAFLASAFSSNHLCLRELNLSNNTLRDSGVKMFAVVYSKLEVLKLRACRLTKKSCSALNSFLNSASSGIRLLDLINNNLRDSVMEMISAVEMKPRSKLQTLRLPGCSLTQRSCLVLEILLSAKLTELDLGRNDLCDSGVKLLSDGLKNMSCKLKTLKLFNCEVTGKACAALVSALMLNPSHLRELNLGGNDLTKSALNLLLALVQDTFCALEKLDSGIQNA